MTKADHVFQEPINFKNKLIMINSNLEYNKQYKKSKRSFKPEHLYLVSGLGSYPSA